MRKSGAGKIKYLAVIRHGLGQWQVESETRKGQMHIVELQDKKLMCSCEDAQLNGNNACKHKRLVDRMLREGVIHA